MQSKLIQFIVILIGLFSQTNAQQVFVNRVFQEKTGNPVFNPLLINLGLNHSKSITNANSDLITVGSTSIAAQGLNLFLTKYNKDGNLIFSINKNTSGLNNDYGIAIVEEPGTSNIFVCGATDNGSSSNYDIILFKFNTNGVCLDSAIYNASSNMHDIPVDLRFNNSGDLIIAASSQTSTGTYDYLVLKYTNNLNFIASNVYDFTSLNDIAIGLEINNSTGHINLIGASASGTASLDYALATFNGSSLNFISDSRNNLPGTAQDQALAYCKDASNNIYITGKGWNGNNFDIKTIKISATYSIVWSSTINPNGFDDAANSIAVDASSGNIVIGGYISNSYNKKEIFSAKLNANNGSIIHQYKQGAENSSGDAFIQKLCTKANGDVYFIANQKGVQGLKHVLVGKIKTNGVSSWQKQIKHQSNDVLVSDMALANDGVNVISVLDSTIKKYLITKFSEFELDSGKVYASNGEPVYAKNQLIVRFLPNALDSSIIDNTNGTAINNFGKLDKFLKPVAYTNFTNAILSSCDECTIHAVKVFPYLTTTFTTTTSRLGENTAMPDFWTTLLLKFPNSTNILQVSNSLESIPNIVGYSHPNFIGIIENKDCDAPATPGTLTAIDPLFNSQYSLKAGAITSYSNANINYLGATNVDNNTGHSFVKGGVFDSGIEWRHEDFGYDGVNNASSRIVDGWDFFSNANFKTLTIPDHGGHGTPVAGIIGAIRNNAYGITGIAGGNDAWANKGVSLHSLGLTNNIQPFFSSANLTDVSNAIVNSAISSSSAIPYSYGLHFQNHSWRIDPIWHQQWYLDSNIVLLTDAIRFVNKLKVTFIASRGNEHNNAKTIPVTLHDDWILSTGGTSYDGEYMLNGVNCPSGMGSSYGSGIDIAAPANPSIIVSCANSPTNAPSFSNYQDFCCTSAAAPHVSGVVALLMSYMNDSTDNYKNLSPEDCEEIIQHSATDVGASGYDSLTGFGRLNAGAAMHLVEKPFYSLYHFGTNTLTPYNITKSVFSNSDTIRLTERYRNATIPPISFQRGKYVVKTFEINATVNHGAINNLDSIMYFWSRPSSSYVFPLFSGALKKIIPREQVTITSLNANNAYLKGYIYQVWDTLGTFKGWIPCDTSFAALFTGTASPHTIMEYSILSKNTTLGLNKKEMNNENLINLYPNPSKDNQTIEIVTQKNCNGRIDLFDLMGRHLKVIYEGKLKSGKNEIQYDTSQLPNSMYIYYIAIDGICNYRKIIKQ